MFLFCQAISLLCSIISQAPHFRHDATADTVLLCRSLTSQHAPYTLSRLEPYKIVELFEVLKRTHYSFRLVSH